MCVVCVIVLFSVCLMCLLKVFLSVVCDLCVPVTCCDVCVCLFCVVLFLAAFLC